MNRYVAFLGGCIPARALLVYLAASLKPQYLPYMAIMAAIIATGFFYIYITGSRTTAFETNGDRVWWTSLRPIHGFLYAYFAYKAWNKHPDAFVPLLIDVILGLGAFITFHFLL